MSVYLLNMIRSISLENLTPKQPIALVGWLHTCLKDGSVHLVIYLVWDQQTLALTYFAV